MRIGIIDADLLDNRTLHPNLVCLKLSGYYKSQGENVSLITDYADIGKYDVVYMSKVFNFTKVPINPFDKEKYPNLHIGGTGFFWKDGPMLADEIEHHMPDYSLYDVYINQAIANGVKESRLKYYRDFSIGFTTRGCVRKCSFCVNEKYDKVFRHSSVTEFLDTSRKYIHLLDDNILAFPGWREIFKELDATGKPFQFRQGMDMRLMTEEKAKVIATSNYRGEYIFAFDNIDEKDLIERKLLIWQKHAKKRSKLYVLCGYYSQDVNDVVSTFERIRILIYHHCLPYIMRHEYFNKSKYRSLYTTIARWCNQPQFFIKMSFRQYCEANQRYKKNQETLCSAMLSMVEFEREYPEVAKKYFDMRWDDFN